MPIHERPPSKKAAPSEPGELEWLNRAIVMLRLAVFEESPPENLGDSHEAEEIFRRVVEMQIELCRSIDVLARDGLIRSCFALLRSMFEIALSIGWLAKDVEGRMEKFRDSRLPPVQAMVSDIGWPKRAYKELYDPLCRFAHGNFVTSALHLEERDLVESWDNGLLRIAIRPGETEEEPAVSGLYERSAESLLAEYGPLLAIHAFDFALATLIRACGSYSDSHPWWPRLAIDIFNRLSIRDHANRHTLWSHEKELLSIQRIEGRYSHSSDDEQGLGGAGGAEAAEPA